MSGKDRKELKKQQAEDKKLNKVSPSVIDGFAQIVAHKDTSKNYYSPSLARSKDNVTKRSTFEKTRACSPPLDSVSEESGAVGGVGVSNYTAYKTPSQRQRAGYVPPLASSTPAIHQAHSLEWDNYGAPLICNQSQPTLLEVSDFEEPSALQHSAATTVVNLECANSIIG